MTTSEFTISGWEVESFRATTFHPLDSRIFERASLWQDVVGTSPQSIDSRPREGVSQHAGELDDRQLVLTARNDRTDWILRPPPEPPAPPSELPTLGDAPAAFESFRRVVGAWLKQSPHVDRLAFGAVLFSEVPDVRTAHSELAEYVKFSADAFTPGCADFLYQINRPTQSDLAPDVVINRLMRWSVMRIETISIALGPEPGRVEDTSSHIVRRLEVDINTRPDSGTHIPQAESGRLFDELAVLGHRVANEGDDQ